VSSLSDLAISGSPQRNFTAAWSAGSSMDRRTARLKDLSGSGALELWASASVHDEADANGCFEPTFSAASKLSAKTSLATTCSCAPRATGR
jgi:hypothetical protein